MGTPDDALRRIDALIQVALRLAATAPTGRVALAKIAAAIDPVWLPQPWGRTIWAELDAARKSALEPLPFRAVERALQDAWGGKPSDELDDLEGDPVAVTPTAQVHRGVLDGSAVAVKVLRPGLAKSVRQDLAVLEGLLSPLGAAFPALDTRGILRELRERALDELDLENEAASQRRFHRALRDNPHLAVPAPHTSLSHEGVLVSDWVEGRPLSAATGSDADAAAARLVVFAIGGARAGIVHCDPDPDDVLLLADGRVAILDFGAVRVVDPERADAALAAVRAFADDDAAAFGTALQSLGMLPGEYGGTALSLTGHALGELGTAGPSRLDVAAVVDARERLFQRPDEAVELLLNGTLPAEDLWPGRGVALLFGSIARVGATGDWRELVVAALEHGWDARV
jgi:hypothetical protein